MSIFSTMTRNCYFDRNQIRRQCHETLDYGVCLARKTSASQYLKIDNCSVAIRQFSNDILVLSTNFVLVLIGVNWFVQTNWMLRYLSKFPLFKPLEDLLYILSNLWILNKLFSSRCFTNIKVAIRWNSFNTNSIHKCNFSFRLKETGKSNSRFNSMSVGWGMEMWKMLRAYSREYEFFGVCCNFSYFEYFFSRKEK